MIASDLLAESVADLQVDLELQPILAFPSRPGSWVGATEGGSVKPREGKLILEDFMRCGCDCRTANVVRRACLRLLEVCFALNDMLIFPSPPNTCSMSASQRNGSLLIHLCML